MPPPTEEKGGVRASVMLLNRLFEVREDNEPGMIIDPSCTGLIRELGGMQYKENTDEIKKVDDHGPDALRYILWPILRLKDTSGGGIQPHQPAASADTSIERGAPPRVPSVSGLGSRNRRIRGSF